MDWRVSQLVFCIFKHFSCRIRLQPHIILILHNVIPYSLHSHLWIHKWLVLLLVLKHFLVHSNIIFIPPFFFLLLNSSIPKPLTICLFHVLFLLWLSWHVYPWYLRINVLCLLVLVCSDLCIIHSPLMLCHNTFKLPL
jgi:hypothetical protein